MRRRPRARLFPCAPFLLPRHKLVNYIDSMRASSPTHFVGWAGVEPRRLDPTGEEGAVGGALPAPRGHAVGRFRTGLPHRRRGKGGSAVGAAQMLAPPCRPIAGVASKEAATGRGASGATTRPTRAWPLQAAARSMDSDGNLSSGETASRNSVRRGIGETNPAAAPGGVAPPRRRRRQPRSIGRITAPCPVPAPPAGSPRRSPRGRTPRRGCPPPAGSGEIRRSARG
jgi:hypothetical protein